MNAFTRGKRWALALAAVSAAASWAAIPATAGAAPARTATQTSYTDTDFLQHALGLPSSDTTPAIESVTYDRFQWLLQQPGKFAFLVGDPATDATFAARAQDVEAAAQTAGAKKVYWFDPNLSGNAVVGTTTEPNLDIRNSAGITSVVAASQTKYGNAWLNVVGQYLGNGVTAAVNSVNTESATVTATTQTATKNDAGGAQVGNPSSGALYDYSSATPANVQDSYFFVYDKDHTSSGNAAKILSWVDLTGESTSSATKADATTAISSVGATNLTQLDQFAWWKSEVNAKQVTQAASTFSGGDVPTLTDADNDAADGGWRVDQITYPELVDLLKHSTDADATILFGGTWCPNTRPVLPSINKYAQQNGVHVFNFDTVLDGGIAGGSTTGSSNPLQVRNTLGSNATSTTKSNPTFFYGDLISQYFTNIKTQYDPAGSSVVTYYPQGGTVTAGGLVRANKLQVPFLVGYHGSAGDAPNGGVSRQWIIDDGDGTYTEYMSSWQYTNPQPNELGLSTIPLTAPIWSTINDQLSHFTWQTDPTTLYPNTALDTDDAQYLVDADKANVTQTPASGTVTSVSAVSNASGAYVVSPTALSAALTALGDSAPTKVSEAKAALIAALNAPTPDPTQIGNLKTVFAAWTVAQGRKSKLLTAWGDADSPGSIAGGIAAVHAADVFFGGLPGGVVSRRTVTADAVKQGTAPKITIAIANDFGRTPTGNVSLVVKQGATTVAADTAAVSSNEATFTLPKLAAGTYAYELTYAGDSQIAPFVEDGNLTVTPGDTPVKTITTTPIKTTPIKTTPVKKPPVRTKPKVKGSVSKAPTHKKAGKYKVTITTPKGSPTATGKVTVTLTKGKTKKKLTGKLLRGVVTVTVPKLAKGTWKVTISWPGDTRYVKASTTGSSIKVKK